jgi:phosphate transport system substrate-binding protein
MLKTIALSVVAAVVATSAWAADITGAGATFPFPIYSKWADDYKKVSGDQLNYQSIGSGAGMKQIDAKTVTFGATDIPVKPEDLDKKGQVQFPMIVGGIVPVVNLKEVEAGKLVLNTDIIAKIYMEKIRRWNDRAIADLNPGIKLPDLPIIKIRRSDGSGTTWNFTRFLAEANADWKKNFGFGQTVEWVGGAIGAKGNDGVAANVLQTNGSIGYVEYAFAKSNNIAWTKMVGADGKAVEPSLKSFQGAWPMIATSYIVMYKAPEDKKAAADAIKFFEFALAHDKEAEALDYVPLTTAQKADVKKTFAQITTK